jgi:hypothetical protein
MKNGIVPAILVAGIIVALLLQVGGLTAGWVSMLDRVSIRLILIVLGVLLACNLVFAAYVHWKVPPHQRIIHRVIGFILSTGSVLTLAPYVASNWELANFEAQFKADLLIGLNNDVSAAGLEFAMKARKSATDAVDRAVWFFLISVGGATVNVFAYVYNHKVHLSHPEQSRPDQPKKLNKRMPKRRDGQTGT